MAELRDATPTTWFDGPLGDQYLRLAPRVSLGARPFTYLSQLLLRLLSRLVRSVVQRGAQAFDRVITLDSAVAELARCYPELRMENERNRSDEPLRSKRVLAE